MFHKIITYWNLHKFPILFAIVSILLYTSFAYDLDRKDFTKLITLFAGLFFFCYKLIQFEKWNFRFLVITGIIFRLIFLGATPNLSQDFFRFIWDGNLIVQGLNPYLHLPIDLIAQEDFSLNKAQQLVVGMGELSASNYSNYPPLNQFIFAISSLLSGKSIAGSLLIMRVFIILADIGILYFGRLLLLKLNKPVHLIFWYFLNPLIILELTGNLHFEGVMLFFFIWSMYLLHNKKWKIAAPIYAMSIAVKLVPIIFLPLFIKHLGLKKSLVFYSLVAGVSVLFFFPFFSVQFLENYAQTIGLWFSNFEFNAGLYNLVKHIAVSFDAKPWELIKVYGKITPPIVITVVGLFTFLADNKKTPTLFTSMVWILSIYYLLATTVHPWYIVFLVLTCLFTDLKHPLIWSFFVFLSYWTYSNPDYKEHKIILIVEYIAIYGFMLYEIIKAYNKKTIFRKI
ncbi:mannosyltransferase [Arenibacter sp. 6A1]|uniref:mannosyltransferase n=1 Tax=Arenibacter sp. 6A1 TaxID=2720391 RepID=UPI0014455521|nr:mannosyltransferase [Arenibacter sp. 6A1]NKI26088.1 mannosyltransferase [Arenibacter sp. 6A1]